MRRAHTAIAGLCATTLALLPSAAWACPYCAAASDSGTAGVVMLGAMIVLPFAVALAVVPAIRRITTEPLEPLPTELDSSS